MFHRKASHPLHAILQPVFIHRKHLVIHQVLLPARQDPSEPALLLLDPPDHTIHILIQSQLFRCDNLTNMGAVFGQFPHVQFII